MAEHELSKKGHVNETLITVRVGENKIKKIPNFFLALFDVHCRFAVCFNFFVFVRLSFPSKHLLKCLSFLELSYKVMSTSLSAFRRFWRRQKYDGRYAIGFAVIAASFICLVMFQVKINHLPVTSIDNFIIGHCEEFGWGQWWADRHNRYVVLF